ncbi:hypothetical protein [Trueperella bialowiezensis]|uniref:Uncharacterized protein n=1 Tax=Trueperella bialowiezensis TaxID=312285 RepID=A0A448PFD8_9ACTO|nr:hypothetical protein [Trueperella bialowiezensis]VEI13642.1 Uncharacterised protein [Trueperella bialowiezensis]
MGVFELRGGKLVPAPEATAGGMASSVLSAVRAQMLEFIDRPLFPVGWIGADAESLLALDPTGQVVTINVIPRLNAQLFVAALARAGRHADMKRHDIAEIYPGGRDAFSADYENFVESSPPQMKRGPRLFIFYVSADAGVAQPLAALRGVGVETYRVVVHDGARGLLVEIAPGFEAREAVGTRQAQYEIGHVLVPEQAEPAPVEAEPEDAESVDAEPTPVDTEPEVSDAEQVEPVDAEQPEQADAQGESASAHPEPAEPDAETVEFERVVVEEEPAEHGESDDQRAVDTEVAAAMQVDEAWEITGWKHEKSRPAKRAAQVLKDQVEDRQHEQATRETRRQEALDKLERERQDTGTTLFEQVKAAVKRPEQRLWDMSAPKRDSDARIYSEQDSSRRSSDAVADAALKSDRWVDENPRSGGSAPEATPEQPAVEPDAGQAQSDASEALTPDPRIQRVVGDVGAVTITWKSRRRRSSRSAQLTSNGLIEISGVGIFADPSKAAAAASGNRFANGWKVWQVPDGRALGDFA